MSTKALFRTFLVGAATGAAAMYLADPQGGERRRRDLRARAEQGADAVGVDLDAAVADARDKAKGVAAEATRPIRESGSTSSDRELTDRVRTQVLDDPRFGALNIDVVDGAATLRGVLEPADARADLVRAVREVPGVDRVIDLTHPATVPAPNL